MAKDWHALIDGTSNVQKLVHLAGRMDSYDQDSSRLEFLRVMRRAFENELTIQARGVGCNRTGRLSSGPLLSQLNDTAAEKAAGIINTYNYDLGATVIRIRSEVPTANRHVYASRVRAWDNKRDKWKAPQIMQDLEQTARSLAQQQFYTHNGKGGAAIMEPRTAVCPVCQGWINRKEVPLAIALANPPPYHPNCPHLWTVYPAKWPKEMCNPLWVGE